MVNYGLVFDKFLAEIEGMHKRAESPDKKTALLTFIDTMRETSVSSVHDVLILSAEVKQSNVLDQSNLLDRRTLVAIRKRLQTILIKAFEEEHQALLSLDDEAQKFVGLFRLRTDIQALNDKPIHNVAPPCQALLDTVRADYERVKSERHLFLERQREEKAQRQEQTSMALEDHPLPSELVCPVVEPKVLTGKEIAWTIAEASGSFLYQGARNSLYFLGGFLPKDLPSIDLSVPSGDALEMLDVLEHDEEIPEETPPVMMKPDQESHAALSSPYASGSDGEAVARAFEETMGDVDETAPEAVLTLVLDPKAAEPSIGPVALSSADEMRLVPPFLERQREEKAQRQEQAFMLLEDHPLPSELVCPVVETKVQTGKEIAWTIAEASGSLLYQGALNSLYFLGGFLPKDLPSIDLSVPSGDALEILDVLEHDGEIPEETPPVMMKPDQETHAALSSPYASGSDGEAVARAFEETMGDGDETDPEAVLTLVLDPKPAEPSIGPVALSSADEMRLAPPVLLDLLDTYQETFDNVLHRMKEIEDNRIVTLRTQLFSSRAELFSKNGYHVAIPQIRKLLDAAENEFKYETGILRYIQPLLDSLRWLVSQVVELFSSGLAKNIGKPHQPKAQVIFEELRLKQTFFGDAATHEKGLFSEVKAFYGPTQ